MANDLVALKQQMQAQAAAYVEQEQLTGGTFLSTRGGTLAFGEEILPGNQACVIVLDAVRENTYYGERFDPNNPMPPICYAFGHGIEPMAPHESMQVDLSYFEPQHDACKGCKWAEWGSADTGRGKACQERRRLALIPAGYYSPKRGSRDFDLEIFTDPRHFKTADFAHIKLPVMSVQNWSKFVNDVAAEFHMPPHGVICRLFLEPDAKSQYKVCFEVVEVIPDDLLPIIMARHDEAERAVVQGYRPPKDKPPAPAQQGSLRGLRRGSRL